MPGSNRTYNFEGICSIVDIVGGHGLLLATILARIHICVARYYVVVALVRVPDGPLPSVRNAVTLPAAICFPRLQRCGCLHHENTSSTTWPDEGAVQLLQACRKGVNSGGKTSLGRQCNSQALSPRAFSRSSNVDFPAAASAPKNNFVTCYAQAVSGIYADHPHRCPIRSVDGNPGEQSTHLSPPISTSFGFPEATLLCPFPPLTAAPPWCNRSPPNSPPAGRSAPKPGLTSKGGLHFLPAFLRSRPRAWSPHSRFPGNAMAAPPRRFDQLKSLAGHGRAPPGRTNSASFL